MHTIYSYLLLFLFSVNGFVNADNTPVDSSLVETETYDSLEIDNQYLSRIDSITFKFYREPNKQEMPDYQALYGFEKSFVPEYSDSVYAVRIAEMNTRSPMEFEFNEDVKSFIQFYGFKYRRHMSRVMALSELYFPLFDEQLDKYNLPLELKSVAIIESALNPVAKSWAGAAGMWQFMLTTGNMYGLQVTSYVDDRYDPIKSTIAACEHFEDLYEIYGDWFLVLSAYNAGPGNVNRAIRRSGGKNTYWEIQEFLPRETQKYVPRFIAVAYLMEYAGEHNIYPMVATISDYQLDTISVKYELDFALLADSLDMTYEEIELLNPCFKKGVIPATPNNQYILRLPYEKTLRFIDMEDSLYVARIREEKKLQEQLAEQKETNVSNGTTQIYNNSASVPAGSNKITHTVSSGESLGVIANKYACSLYQLRSWNNINGNMIHPGQKLVVYSKTQGSSTSTNNTSTSNNNNSTSSNKKIKSYSYYAVKNGDSLWGIAQKYVGVNVEDIKKANRLSSNKLNIGQTLKIPKF
jgi:peptidoglycan lytic transglycosylase D